MNKKGSLAIEAAIGFTVLLIVISIMVTAMNIQRCDMVMQQSIDQATEDIQVLLPYTVLGAEAVKIMSEDADIGQAAAEAYDSITELMGSIEDLTGTSLEEMVLDRSLGKVIRDDIAAEYEKRSRRLMFKPSDISVDLSYSPDNDVIDMCVSYEIETVFGSIIRTHYSAIPFYGVYNSVIESIELPGSEEGSDESPWGLSNFQRGEYFEEKYGANLPHTFPVINKFENGDCEVIMSIDLTKNTYSSDSRINSKINSEMEKLIGFNDVDVTIKSERYIIRQEDITSKTMTVIIPENTPDDRLSALEEALNACNDGQITVNIYKDNIST